MPDGPALRLELRPSRLLTLALVLVHGLALAAVWIGLGGWARYGAGAMILVSAAGCLLQVLLRAPSHAVSLELRADGRASWRNRRGTWHEGMLGSDHFVSAAFVVLELQETRGGRKRVVLAADSVPPDDFRHLCVWLRWRRRPDGSDRE